MLHPGVSAKVAASVPRANLHTRLISVVRQQALQRERLRQTRRSRDEAAGCANRPFESLRIHSESGRDRPDDWCSHAPPRQDRQRESGSREDEKGAAEHGDP